MTLEHRDVPAPLPSATWSAHLPGSPRELDEQNLLSGARLTVLAPVSVHATVGGAPIAVLPVESAPGLRTWLPVIGGQPGWAQVLLPSRPDGICGWVQLHPQVLVLTHLVHLVIDTRARTLTLHHGRSARTWECEFGAHWPHPSSVEWSCGVGKGSNPTPRGHTFVVGEVHPATGIVDHALVLAAHMPTHLAHGAGIAAVGVHSWPSPSWGTAGTDGSLVVPPEAMPVLAEAARPGTVVLIH